MSLKHLDFLRFLEVLEGDFRGCSRLFREGCGRFLVEKMKGNKRETSGKIRKVFEN